MVATAYRDLLAEGREALRQASDPSASFDSMELLCAAAGAGRAALMSALRDPAPPQVAARYRSMLARRLERHEPVQYICGEWPFMGLPFSVGPGVLIPRADTECLAELALSAAKAAIAARRLDGGGTGRIRILDLCTGSGCLAVSLAHALPCAEVAATDISSDALAYARANAERNGVLGRVEFHCGDLFDALPGGVAPSGGGSSDALPGGVAPFDIIVANPPYIPTADIGGLPLDVRLHEPSIALDGGADGLEFYRRISAGSRRLLRGGGPSGGPFSGPSGVPSGSPRLFVEVGDGQAKSVAAIFRGAGFALVATARDLRGVERALAFSTPG